MPKKTVKTAICQTFSVVLSANYWNIEIKFITLQDLMI